MRGRRTLKPALCDSLRARFAGELEVRGQLGACFLTSLLAPGIERSVDAVPATPRSNNVTNVAEKISQT
jgi:hypothetical protein